MKLLRICAAIALACAIAAPAVAQDVVPVIAPTSASGLLTLMYGALALLITTLVPAVPTVVWFLVRSFIADQKLKDAQHAEQLRSAVNGGVQKAVAGELAKIDYSDAKLKGLDREQVINSAGTVVAKNFSESLTGLGIEDADKLAKGKEMAATTLGLMDAQAAGNPVPNPSQPITAPSTQNVTVTPPKK